MRYLGSKKKTKKRQLIELEEKENFLRRYILEVRSDRCEICVAFRKGLRKGILRLLLDC